MALDDLTGKNIQDTYKRLVQTEGNTFADGSGSAITTFNVTSSHAISASYALSASHEITYELSSSHAETADALTPGIDIDVRNITASGNISSSGYVYANRIYGDSLGGPYWSTTNTNWSTNGGILANQHITASGNISASGNLYGIGLNLDNKDFVHWFRPGDYFRISAGGEPVKIIANVTASGNISASGNITADKIYFQNTVNPGANYLEWDGTGLHYKGSSHINGHLTASGDISASGNVYVKGGTTKGVYVNNEHALGTSTTVTEGSLFGDTSWTGIHIGRDGTNNKNIELHGPVTSSGDISASGDVIGTVVQAASALMIGSNRILINNDDIQIRDTGLDVVGHITASGDISASGAIHTNTIFGNGTLNINPNSNGPQFAAPYSHTLQVYGGIKAKDNSFFMGHLTASGNISASGNIYGDDLIATGELFTTGTGVNKIEGILTLGSANVPAGGNKLLVTGTSTFTSHITASGNISGSGTSNLTIGGTATANTGSFHVLKGDTTQATGLEVAGYLWASGSNGHITASGDISASGDVYAESIILPFGQAVNWGDHSGNHISVDSSTGNIIFDSLEVQMQNGLDVAGTNGHITASGNISASGDVYADKFYSNNVQVINNNNGVNYFGKTGVPTELVGNVTASGNISASGAVGGFIQGRTIAASSKIGLYTVDGLSNPISGTGVEVASLGANNTILNLATDSGITELNIGKEGGTTRPRIFGHITASGNISASGAIIATSFAGAALSINGSLINFSNYLTSIPTGTYSSSLQTLTNITASGNISSSGNIVADYYDAKTSGVGYKLSGVKLVYLDNSAYTFGRDAATRISGSTIELSGGHITASGNISASGIITAEGLVISDDASITDNLSVGGNIDLSNTKAFTIDDTGGSPMNVANINGSNILTFGDDARIAHVDGTVISLDSAGTIYIDSDSGDVRFQDNASTSITFNTTAGHITASGNISSSGDIIGNRFTSDGQVIVLPNGTTSATFSNNSITTTNIKAGTNIVLGTDTNVSGHITASGNISASGVVSSSGLHVDSNDTNLYSYSYLSYTCVGTVPAGPNYLKPSGNGISNHSWNQDSSVALSGNQTIGSSVISLGGTAMVGMIIPHDTIIVGFYGMTRGNTHPGGGGVNTEGHALWVSEEADIDWGGSTSWNATLRFFAGNTAGNNGKKFKKIDGMTGATEFPVQAGDMILPTIWNVNAESTTQNITIVFKTKLGV